jgi:hypothetical protein
MRNHRIADVTCSSGYCPHTPIHILCPGGSREEVTIDMEAGAKRYIEKWNELAPFANTKECFKAAFDAALGITEDKK